MLTPPPMDQPRNEKDRKTSCFVVLCFFFFLFGALCLISCVLLVLFVHCCTFLAFLHFCTYFCVLHFFGFLHFFGIFALLHFFVFFFLHSFHVLCFFLCLSYA